MRKNRLLIVVVFLAAVLMMRPVTASGDVLYTNSQTGYQVIVDDGLDLLNDAEEKRLLMEMMPITEYGNVAFVSANAEVPTGAFARERYNLLFGDSSGTMFVVDLGNRNIWIYSHGDVYKTITKGYANTITDNVYRDGAAGRYYECAAAVYRQEYTLLKGGKIARPMKHITNAIFAFIAALLGNFLVLKNSRKKEKAEPQEIFAATTLSKIKATGEAVMISQKKSRRVESSSYSSGSSGGYSGGSSHSSGGGGYSGGGSHSSGGGGGHRI
ncbi:MAG: TPM domain-containing protein [Solobacterium sp.]|nr:TPM domain-containing protein [Solobacterium sp.]MBR0214242.1 TPM domain-containing protein [Solobacterium sp.]